MPRKRKSEKIEERFIENRRDKRARIAETLSVLIIAELSGIPLPPGSFEQSRINEAIEYLRNIASNATNEGA